MSKYDLNVPMKIVLHLLKKSLFSKKLCAAMLGYQLLIEQEF